MAVGLDVAEAAVVVAAVVLAVVVEVAVDSVVLGSGDGRSRREAETHAAEAALEHIRVEAAKAVSS